MHRKIMLKKWLCSLMIVCLLMGVTAAEAAAVTGSFDSRIMMPLP